MQEGQILNDCQALFPHLKQLLEDIKVFYSEKLWHQLTECLLKYIQDEQVLKNGPKLTELYTGFIKNFENNMDPIKLVRFICRVSEYQGSEDNKIAFMDHIINKSVKEEQAIYVCRLKRAEFLLNKLQFEEVDKIFQEVITSVSKVANIDTLVHSRLYKLGYQYNKIQKNYDELYKYGLQFLAYTSEQDISASEKHALSLEMAQAILISPKIYNFSELLQQPVLQSLKNSNEEWVFRLLETFNEGNVQNCYQYMQSQQQQIQGHQLLNENQKVLQEKIRIMAFLDLVFNQPKNQRNITFEVIANVSNVPLQEVELLLIRAMAIGLVKGKINQIKGVISIEWVIPRILDTQRIKIMSQKLENWQVSLQGVFQLINAQQQKQ